MKYKGRIKLISNIYAIFHKKGRSAHNRASDRTNDDRLYCNDNTGYREQAANSIVAGHLLRQLIKHVRIIAIPY